MRTDDYRYFRLPLMGRGRVFVIEAVAEDWLPAFSVPLSFSGAAMEGVTARLAQVGQRVRVRVIGPGGAPVPGAMVRLQASAEALSYTGEQRRSRTFWEATHRLSPAGTDGWVEFRGIPPGRVTVVAGRPGGKLVKQEAVLELGRALDLIVAVP